MRSVLPANAVVGGGNLESINAAVSYAVFGGHDDVSRSPPPLPPDSSVKLPPLAGDWRERAASVAAAADMDAVAAATVAAALQPASILTCPPWAVPLPAVSDTGAPEEAVKSCCCCCVVVPWPGRRSPS